MRLSGRGRGGAFLRAYLASIPNADRLGEIALVDGSSPIGRTGRVYYNALLDENAVTHMAFGEGFRDTRPAGSRGRGVNLANAHVDVMLGSDELVVTGIDTSGRRLPIIRDGAWQV